MVTNMTESSTKQKIMKLLKRDKKLTVSQIAEQLGITEVGIRRHLKILVRDKFITSTSKHQSMGRPFQVYELTNEGESYFPHHYENFSINLLKDLEGLHGKKIINELLEKRANRIKNEYQKELNGLSFKDKVERLSHLQEDKGFMVDCVDNGDGSFTLHQHHCPIIKVAEEYQFACGAEAKVFKDVLGSESVSVESSLINGQKCCSFKITPKPAT